ncbi:hypothetical protein C3489_35070, partial [Streptomyces sp. Ru71]
MAQPGATGCLPQALRAGGTPSAHPCRPGGTSQALKALGEARLPAAGADGRARPRRRDSRRRRGGGGVGGVR